MTPRRALVLLAIAAFVTLPPAAAAQQRVDILDSLTTFEAPAGWPVEDNVEQALASGFVDRALSVGSMDEHPWLKCDVLTAPRQSLGTQQQTANQMMQMVPPSVGTLETDELLHHSILDLQGVSIRQFGVRSDDAFFEVRQFWLIDGPTLHTIQVDCAWLDDGSDAGNEEARASARSFFESMKINRP